MALIADIFKQDSAAVAVRLSGGVDIDYRRFCEDIDVFANWLRGQEIGVGTRVAIRLVDHSYWNWIAHLAAMRVGAHHATVSDASQTLQRAADLGFEACLSVAGDDKVPEGLRNIQVPVSGLEPLAKQLGVAAKTWDRPKDEAKTARTSFTSGTTGMPRALLWDYDHIGRRVEQVRESAKIGRDTRCFVAVGLLTTAGFRYPLATWQSGGLVIQRDDSHGAAEMSREVAVGSNLLVASPINLRNYLQALPKDWPGKTERTVIVLGGRLPPGLRDQALSSACARIEINYGSTETGSVAAGEASLLDRHPGAVGFLRPNVTAEVLAANGEPAPTGKPGILRLRTSLMNDGYEGEESGEFSGQGFKDGWFYPGDIAVLFEDGLLAIEGRNSDTANVGGLKIAVADIETKLLGITGVRDGCLIPVTLEGHNELAVVLAIQEGLRIAQFQAVVRAMVPKNVPIRLVQVPAIPRNAMGKVPRRQLAERLATLIASGRQRNAGGQQRRAG